MVVGELMSNAMKSGENYNFWSTDDDDEDYMDSLHC